MRNLLLVALLALTTTVFSTNYYVSNTGNDSNNGRSPSTAWQTLKNVNSQTFQPGDSILFERGGVWNERLQITSSGSPSEQITYSAYGEGDKPVFNGIDEVEGWTTAGNWKNEGNNVWSINTAYGGVYGRVWIDGEEKERSRYTAEGVGITDRYPWQKINNRLYVYSSANPAGIFSSLKMTNRRAFFSSTSNIDYITINGLEIRGWFAIELSGCSHWVIEHCDITKSGLRGIDINRSSRKLTTNGIIRHCTFDSQYPFHTIRLRTIDADSWDYMGTDFAIRLSDGGQADWDIHDNYFKGWGYTLFWVVNHGENGYMTEGIRFYNNYTDQSGQNYGRAFASHQYTAQVNENNPIEIFNNVFYSPAVQSQIGTPYLKIYNNLFIGARGRDGDGNRGDANALSFSGYPGRTSYKNKIYNNVFAYGGFAGMFWSLREGRDPVEDLELVNNIFYNNGEYNSWRQLNISDHAAHELINPKIENNIFWADERTNIIRYPRQSMNVSQFNSLDGNNPYQLKPLNNIQADPLFVDPQNGDFRLRENSPAIGAGLPPISETDRNGNPWQAPYTIGPYAPANSSFILTLTAEGIGSVEVIPALEFYPPGTVIQLSATPGVDWQFSGWDGDVISSNLEMSLVIESNMEITANFSTMITNAELPESDAKVRIYPNPAKDHITISVEGDSDYQPESFTIIDMAGRIVYKDLLNTGKAIVQIPGHLRSGIYVIELFMKGLPFHSQRLMIRN